MQRCRLDPRFAPRSRSDPSVSSERFGTRQAILRLPRPKDSVALLLEGGLGATQTHDAASGELSGRRMGAAARCRGGDGAI